MKALWADGKGALKLREIPEQELPAGEARVAVRCVGICRTDLELVRGYMDFTGIPGHEFVGVVREGPEGLLGRRVVGEINAPCWKCEFCLGGLQRHCPYRSVLGILHRPGACAESLTLPVDNLLSVPDGVSDEEAVFCEPLAAALEIFEQVHITPGERVLVVGDGKLGLLVAQVFTLLGCRVFLQGRHSRKLALAARWGVATVEAREEHASASARFGGQFPWVVECTGAPEGFRQALAWVRPRGTLVLKSTYAASRPGLDATRVVVDELRIVGSRCGRLAPALRLLAQGKLDVRCLIDHRKPLAQGTEAFELAARPGALKVLLSVS